ncbi:hypothetical protein G9C85_14460 [Halorubellus sp. JP-L1]|uniref:hypothetical protein n=1 Tax=Halorubellus sp. JP-L1 TaxID=2715753 RepID=UPI00140AE363|nr:hypothetical protein [Halorubellus sp. JP-L1]NHN42820.1 hypothetical protein [Halorubellus sp. JP-L1]
MTDAHEDRSPERSAVSVEVDDRTIRATDSMDNQGSVETSGWDEIQPRHDFPQEMDAVVAGRVSNASVQAKFPTLSIVHDDGDLGESRSLEDDASLELDAGQYHLNVDTPVSVSLRFQGPATVTWTDTDRIKISFDQPEAVSIGFASWLRYPRNTVTVPRTTEGLATAVSQFSAALQTTKSGRTGDPNRQHPPTVEYGDAVDVPDAVQEHVPDTGLRVVVPDRLDAIMQVAPLAYYLGAVVEIDAGPPRLESTDGGFVREFASPPRLQFEVAALLRRMFLVESLVRHSETVNASPRELDFVDDIDLDVSSYDTGSDLERLKSVLATDFDAISDALPEWHVASFVEPTFEHAKTLPYLLRYLSPVFDPSAYPRDGEDSALLEEFSATIPDRLRRGTPHGSALAWVSSEPRPDDQPFVGTLSGFANGSRYVDRSDGAGRVLVVCNDSSRASTAASTADRYRTHTPDSVTVEMHASTTRRELAALFEDGADFLHFVGDATDGLACEDGVLDPSSVSASNARLLFLDSPAGTATARTYLERGSVGAFASTANQPPSEPLRETLTGTLTRGFTAEQAVRYANTMTDGSRPLVAIGDGFQLLARSMTLYSPVASVEGRGTNEFAVTVYPYVPEAGFVWRPEPLDVRSQLCGAPFELSVSGPELEELVHTENVVLVYDDVVHWNDHLDFFNPLV